MYVCTLRYGLELIRIQGGIREALSDLKSSHPHLKAVCMGTRSTDPHSGDHVCVWHDMMLEFTRVASVTHK